jgi:hypothetical protein
VDSDGGAFGIGASGDPTSMMNAASGVGIVTDEA